MSDPVKSSVSFGKKIGLSHAHATTLARLKTPEKIQDYLNTMPINFEAGGDTCLPVAEAMRQNHAHCIEGAFIAACALWLNGKPPLLMDMQAKGDDDHVVALFRHGKYWGAISKSNHVWLRWRDPVYRSLRELTMSYFHEYVTGPKKTLSAYSTPFNMNRYDPKVWVAATESCWDVAWDLDHTRHYRLMPPGQSQRARPRDAIEITAGKLVDFKERKK